MNPYEQEANALLVEAKKKLSRGFFDKLFGWAPKVEEAIEFYHRAGNLYKVSNNWEQAGIAFSLAGDLCVQTDTLHDAAASFANAAMCFKKVNQEEAVRAYLRAIDIYVDMGKFTTAAKYHVNIAEMFEKCNATLEKAVQHYEQAADYYMGEESISFGNKYLLKVAEYSALAEQYDKAIKIYEKVSDTAIGNSLLKYSAKEYLFRATLCHLCIDVLNAIHAIGRYVNMHPIFQESRECKFLSTIIKCIEEEDVVEFSNAVREYDSISKLDDWFATILLRIKRRISGFPDIR